MPVERTIDDTRGPFRRKAVTKYKMDGITQSELASLRRELEDAYRPKSVLARLEVLARSYIENQQDCEPGEVEDSRHLLGLLSGIRQNRTKCRPAKSADNLIMSTLRAGAVCERLRLTAFEPVAVDGANRQAGRQKGAISNIDKMADRYAEWRRIANEVARENPFITSFCELCRIVARKARKNAKTRRPYSWRTIHDHIQNPIKKRKK